MPDEISRQEANGIFCSLQAAHYGFGSIESVPDPKNLLGRLLPADDAAAFLLSGIESYG
jgi:hypothetical protein